jgi:hypothetical protein
LEVAQVLLIVLSCPSRPHEEFCTRGVLLTNTGYTGYLITYLLRKQALAMVIMRFLAVPGCERLPGTAGYNRVQLPQDSGSAEQPMGTAMPVADNLYRYFDSKPSIANRGRFEFAALWWVCRQPAWPGRVVACLSACWSSQRSCTCHPMVWKKLVITSLVRNLACSISSA